MAYIVRKIRFKREGDISWNEGDVIKVGKPHEADQNVVDIVLPNDDVVKVDMTKTNFQWEYSKYQCHLREKSFDMKKGLKMHIKRSYPEDEKECFEDNVNFVGNKFEYFCNICDYELDNIISLTLHKHNHHTQLLTSCLKKSI